MAAPMPCPSPRSLLAENEVSPQELLEELLDEEELLGEFTAWNSASEGMPWT
eukprot:CAMPEP_0177554904 /NCGR_PEP_ID=MMETSP0369-20130122/68226_1 /TAXON_ID=447022 ORGANISM="Scrippsiella hangoei-like, Strain SHHI-4" /NCGR_SAMPLE_ID=MMETSP0369 /ASSEMBLY_ACC=CAM_ASM_000364 /LENGTH=51 /DNA_ID=CAMNT_0019040947 /DNA_START=546 /DNA_END=697 /DNA_ORIENTATION=+